MKHPEDDRKSPPIGINLSREVRQEAGRSVGARAAGSGWVGLHGRPWVGMLQGRSQGNRTRATIKDSVAQIGLDKWTRREPGEKLGGEGDHAHPRGDGTCHCNHKDWSPFPKPRADWLT